ncbi:hypothetical protein IJ750_05270 [bacterium]|nr:hypothetical protein [bacterium]MBR1776462.1 hypothetical protein [bacterium]
MSLASNIVSSILSNQISGKSGISQILDLNDKTFADILEKQFNIQVTPKTENTPGSFGVPAGMLIQDISNIVNGSDNINGSHSYSCMSDFNKRQALNFYNRGARNSVINLNEFMADAFN